MSSEFGEILVPRLRAGPGLLSHDHQGFLFRNLKSLLQELSFRGA